MFLVLRITPKSRAKVCAQWRTLKPPCSLLATDRSKAVVLVYFVLNGFGVGVSCRNLYSFVVYLYVNGSGSITSVGKERELICLLLFTCFYVVSVLRGYLFLWVLGMGCVILLWHSLSLPYNYFGMYNLYYNVINQVISYWPSYRSEVCCIGPRRSRGLIQQTEDL